MMDNYLDRVAARIRELVPDNAMPRDVPSSDLDDLFRIYAVLALGRGDAVTARDVHNAWAAWMLGRDPSHDAIVPFEELADEERAEDTPFVQAIRAAARTGER